VRNAQTKTKQKRPPRDANQAAHAVVQHVIKLTEMPKRFQIGKIIITKLPRGTEAEFALMPCRANNKQDDQRILFLAKVAGVISRICEGNPKESSRLWGSDKGLVLEVRFSRASAGRLLP
jgi:hypothetical protein